MLIQGPPGPRGPDGSKGQKVRKMILPGQATFTLTVARSRGMILLLLWESMHLT